MSKQALRWAWFWEPGRGYNPRVRELAAGAHGCYAFRDGAEVVYVGESHTGRLWKTLLRHFQGMQSGKFEDRREWVYQYKDAVEVSLWLTRTGQQAMDLETELIERYQPTNRSETYQPDWDLIMGRARDDEEEAPF